ncbi:Exosome complex component rrp4 [Cryptotrichosporon argae]
MFKVTRQPPLRSLAFSDADGDAGMDVDVDDDERIVYAGAGEGAGGRKDVVSPGEVITSAKEFMRGHGTYVEDDNVVSSVAGTVERVNKLVSVQPLSSRYTPQVGDLVIGRIAEVGPSRWRVDTGARQDAVLMLSSVNLPGGVQRRKIESDALKMREFLAEGDLLVAEVQSFFGDGATSLHTRSLRYGKLRNGLLVTVAPRLVRRLKSHFIHVPPPCGPSGVDVVLGLNGWVWVSLGTGEAQREGGEGFDAEGVYRAENDEIEPDARRAITTVAAVVAALAAADVAITDTLIADGYGWAARAGVDGRMLDAHTAQRMLGALVA